MPLFAASSLPPWLVDHCVRLQNNDENLSNLNLNIRRLTLEMMEELVSALRHNNVLTVLNLTSSLINNPAAIEPLTASIVPQHVSLQILHLGHNRLATVSLQLANNSVLKELYLEYNALGPVSCQYLAHGLRQNSVLQVLQLNYNLVGNAGCEALAQAMQHNSSLLVLGLQRNGISDASSLVQILEDYNVWIRRIRLEQNNDIPAVQQTRIRLLSRANAAGRRFLRHAALDDPLWPRLLHRLDYNLKFFFFQQKPELLLLFRDNGDATENDNPN